MLQGNEGDFYFVGSSRSSDGEIPRNQGEHDLLLVKAKYNVSASHFNIYEKIIPKAEITLEVPEFISPARKRVFVPVLLKEKKYLAESGVEEISFNLTYNPTLLFQNELETEMLDEKHALLKFENIAIEPNSDETLVSIMFYTALGNSESCDLVLSDVSVSGGEAEITIIDGKFNLDGVCHEGGVRFFADTQIRNGIMDSFTEPVNDIIEVKIGIIEKGRYELDLYDMNGKKIKSILNQTFSEQEYKLVSSDVSSLPQGKYFIILKTPSMSESKMITIIR